MKRVIQLRRLLNAAFALACLPSEELVACVYEHRRWLRIAAVERNWQLWLAASGPTDSH